MLECRSENQEDGLFEDDEAAGYLAEIRLSDRIQ